MRSPNHWVETDKAAHPKRYADGREISRAVKSANGARI
jgi:hypothetical protein